MGQIVHYGNMNNYKRERALKWIDKGQKSSSVSEKKSLAKLIPIKDTFNFDHAVNQHHERTCGDVKSCMRGSKINKQ